MTIKFFSSVDNYDRAKASIKQSITAFQAGLTAEAYNSDMQVKMALTTFTHAARFLTNAGYVFFNIVNTVYNLGKEKNPGPSQQFYRFLYSGTAQSIFRKYGYLVN